MSSQANLTLVSGCDGGEAAALAAAVAVEVAVAAGVPVVLAELDARPRGPTLLAASGSREVETELRRGGVEASARGHLCHLALPAAGDGLDALAAVAAVAPGVPLFAAVAARSWNAALERADLEPDAGLLLVELPRDRSIAALAAAELGGRGVRARIAPQPLGPVAARRALAGVRAGGRQAGRLARIGRWVLGAARDGRGQALPAVLGAAFAVIALALALAAIGGAVTGKGRAQRVADLAALSAARSMRDDLPRALAPARLPGGAPNPRHLPRSEYLRRARAAALGAAARNGVDPARLELEFPGAVTGPPVRARVGVRAEIAAEALPAPEEAPAPEPIPVQASATAEAAPPSPGWTGVEGRATGGGYSGALAYRDGEGMRPDVAAAYDRMSAAAGAAGVALAVSSGFRSDAEQAALFAAHPDPRWVAPPGRSLHRCATELDLGPASAYGWLAAHAERFGFVKRYSWEPWHFGFAAGPAPCSRASASGGLAPSGSDSDGPGTAAGLPSFVPRRFRDPLLRSAGRWGVSAALLAAQLEAESGFDPGAVSPAGAQGIAQFMPGTAASYGLRDPFDPEAAIDAQAHLMSDLLRQFRAIPLALAAYNAGPGAVAPCMCVPPYPETRAYVARILALLDGAGAMLVPPLEVRLVA